ncbi:hypothetical protein P3T35_007903 [Kitasatospora sp. GP30]|nr:hypothetical protein [Kitasatospora sp. GP30]
MTAPLMTPAEAVHQLNALLDDDVSDIRPPILSSGPSPGFTSTAGAQHGGTGSSTVRSGRQAACSASRSVWIARVMAAWAARVSRRALSITKSWMMPW